jgi:hypothetical protein
MARRNEMTNQNQNQQKIIKAQVPESRNGENQHLDVAVSECGSEASEKIVPSSLTTPTGQQHRVTPGPTPDDKQSSELEPSIGERGGKASSRKGTGPQTRAGKQRSKHNARKHGIGSKEIILDNESPAEFKLLQKGLWQDFAPQGAMEEEILNDLVLIRWYKRRVHRAVNAILAEKLEFVELDRIAAQRAEAWASEQSGGALAGMLRPGGNHFVLEKGIEFLNQIRSSVEARGFRAEIDYDLLKKLYGVDVDGKPQSGAFHFYLWLARCASDAEKDEQNADLDEYKKMTLQALDIEIGNLTVLKSVALDVERERSKYRADQALFSRQATLDLYIRYDTYLSRETDRLLNRLERLQRMRNGQPLPPQLDVKIS